MILLERRGAFVDQRKMIVAEQTCKYLKRHLSRRLKRRRVLLTRARKYGIIAITVTTIERDSTKAATRQSRVCLLNDERQRHKDRVDITTGVDTHARRCFSARNSLVRTRCSTTTIATKPLRVAIITTLVDAPTGAIREEGANHRGRRISLESALRRLFSARAEWRENLIQNRHTRQRDSTTGICPWKIFYRVPSATRRSDSARLLTSRLLRFALSLSCFVVNKSHGRRAEERKER